MRALVLHKRIRTTVTKAKEASAFADKMITIAKRANDLHTRRLLVSKLGSDEIAQLLIKEIVPHFKDKKGGYTRILKLSRARPGDASDMALLEFSVLIEAPEKAKKAKKSKKSKQEKETKEETPPAKPAKEKEKQKAPETPATDKGEKPKDESEKKGGFLGTLRRFLKGSD